MDDAARSETSALGALVLALLALPLLGLPLMLTSGSAGSGRWLVWLLFWVEVVPAGLLLVGAYLLARAALRTSSTCSSSKRRATTLMPEATLRPDHR